MQQKRLTKNQQIIMDTFFAHPIHPTTEQLFDLIRSEYPKIGLSTLYRVLGQLVQIGMLQKISGLETKEHYDHTLRPHAHFICEKCASVWDVPDGLCDVPVEKLEKQMGCCCGSVQLNVRGVCSKCHHNTGE